MSLAISKVLDRTSILLAVGSEVEEARSMTRVNKAISETGLNLKVRMIKVLEVVADAPMVRTKMKVRAMVADMEARAIDDLRMFDERRTIGR